MASNPTEYTEHPEHEEWLFYLDGAMNSAELRNIRRHIEDCAYCARFLSSVTAVRARLRTEADRLRDADGMSDQELEAMLERCLDELAPPRWTPREGMLMLRLMLEPICGSGTAGVTMRLAIERSTAGAPERVTERNWSLFVANLSDAMASVCGSAAGRLVSRAGVCLAIGEG